LTGGVEDETESRRVNEMRAGLVVGLVLGVRVRIEVEGSLASVEGECLVVLE
jgi:hypothetical protein